MTRLGKAPIVEAWVGFEFAPHSEEETSPEWAQNVARKFLEKYSSNLPEVEFNVSRTVGLSGGSFEESPHVVHDQFSIDAVRAHDLHRTRLLQLTRQNRLMYHVVCSGQDYPGYSDLRETALTKLQDYIAALRPPSVVATALFYKDIIELEEVVGETVELSDYFPHIPDMPSNPFGQTAHFTYRTVFQQESSPGYLTQTIQPLPQNEAEKIRIQITWESICGGLQTLDTEEIAKSLDDAHTHTLSCFQASVSNKLWQMFEPES